MKRLERTKMDIEEGADIVMVKPAMPYLDIIKLLRMNLKCQQLLIK